MQQLIVLSRSSSRVATFAVRPCAGRVVEYTYKNKKDNQTITAYKFEVWLVGQNPQHYCVGYIKGTEPACRKASLQYHAGTVWALSQVVFDTFTTATYISTPIGFRVDLAKSTTTILNADSGKDVELCANMPKHPEPPRTVAEVSRINTNRSTDLIAMIKHVSTNRRKTKSGEEVVDVELVDNSRSADGKLAAIVVSVFGTDKIQKLADAAGSPMAFFNLSVSCSGQGNKPTINHWGPELVVAAPECEKTKSLREKKEELASETNTDKLTADWVGNQSRDVSGPQPLSCAAFLDYTSETPHAALPEVNQLMWVHIEEPDRDAEVVDGSGERLWYRVATRDISGSVLIGITQRSALTLAGCSSKDEFLAKQGKGELNMPLLCHARVSRIVRTIDGAAQSIQFVNHTLEAVEPVNWEAASAPNSAFQIILGILNNCPQHDAGIHYAFLADIQPDPYYGMRLVYDGEEGPRGHYVAALVASSSKSLTTQLSEQGYKVVTSAVKDVANTAGSIANPVGDYSLVGYCSMESLPGFRLDPPRGKAFRVALVLFTSADDTEGLHVHKLEYIEPDQVNDAVQCIRKLRTLSRSVHSVSTEKRSHSMLLGSPGTPSPRDAKRAKTLQRAPTAD